MVIINIFKIGYGTSKWASEKLLYRAIEEQKKDVFIYRPGHLVSLSKNENLFGFNENDYLSLLLLGIIESKSFPPINDYAEWTSVHTTAELIYQGILNQYDLINEKKPNQYNIFTNHKTSYELFYEALIEEGYDIKKVDKNIWNEKISNINSSLFPLNFLLKDGIFGSNVNEKFSCNNIYHLKNDINFDKIEKYHIKNWIKFLKKNNNV
jgi:thioester reductase-like protein